MQSKNIYIIGDIHGEFNTLLKLIKKIPKNSELVFVGDLIDRGNKSNEVIKFVRKNDYKCVLGNHEELMIHYGKLLIASFPNIPYMDNFHNWINKGGKQTLLSYGLISINEHDDKLHCIEDKKKLKQFYDDIKWLETLPLYIEIKDIKINNKPIIISHASIANEWHLLNDKKKKDILKEKILWSRKEPKNNVSIFNIFGHTVVKQIDTSKHFIDVDTGCHYKDKGYGKLSAYCIQTNEVLSVKKQ